MKLLGLPTLSMWDRRYDSSALYFSRIATVVSVVKTVLIIIYGIITAVGENIQVEDSRSNNNNYLESQLQADVANAVVCPTGTAAAAAAAADTGSGCFQFVTYHEGSAIGWPPVVLSAPHAGSLKPVEIADRDAGCWDQNASLCIWSHSCGVKDPVRCKATTDDDFSTHELASRIRDELCALFDGSCPALVLNNLARIKFDANRDKPEATFGVDVVEAAFDKYNGGIDDAKRKITRHHGVGLFVDVHGQGHPIQRAELGYLFRPADLDSGVDLDPALSSISTLARRKTTSAAEFDDLLRGSNSFGAFLEEHGYPAVPSPSSRGPGAGNPYFNGGYLTRRHGSKNGGTVDAIQIESSRSSRQPGAIRHYARSVAHAIRRFVCEYYTAAEQDITSVSRDVIANDCSRNSNRGATVTHFGTAVLVLAVTTCLLLASQIYRRMR